MTRSSACGRMNDQGGKRPTRQARERRKKRRKRKRRRKKRRSLRRKEGSAEGDPDGGQGQWRARRGTGDCHVACGVDVALVRAARHCLVPGGHTAQTPTPPPPYTARTLWWRWQARRGVVVGPRPMLGKRRAPWGCSSVVAAGPRGGGHRCRSEPQGAWEPQKQNKGRCKGDASAMQGRHTGDARRTPWALPWQQHGSGADLRWKGRREEENNAPVQSDQLLRRTGLAHQDKVQTRRQTGQVTVTVTHNREERRRVGWQRAGEAPENTVDRATRGRRARGDGGGRPTANDRGWRR